MNRKLKEGMNNLVGGIALFFREFGQSCASILRICVLSSVWVAHKSKSYSSLKGSNNCCVLGNGPSLKDDFDNGRVRTEGNDIFCVNMFCSSPLFYELRPKFYFLIDGALFVPSKSERIVRMQKELISALNQVDWGLYLVLSSAVVSGGDILKSINNRHVTIIKMNSTDVNGFRNFRHWVYRHRLGMPRCQTVINFALGTAISMNYDNVYLYGTDHTWTRDLFVNDDNVVCYGDRHVYNKSLTVVKKEGTFADLLGQFAKMFMSHYLLEEYSKSVGVKIWNCASDTFLDAYERNNKSF